MAKHVIAKHVRNHTTTNGCPFCSLITATLDSVRRAILRCYLALVSPSQMPRVARWEECPFTNCRMPRRQPLCRSPRRLRILLGTGCNSAARASSVSFFLFFFTFHSFLRCVHTCSERFSSAITRTCWPEAETIPSVQTSSPPLQACPVTLTLLLSLHGPSSLHSRCQG